MQTPYAPHRLPDDVAGLLSTFELTLGGLLTTTSAKARHTTAAGVALSAMHYALPHRALARAIDPGTVAPTAPRGYVPALAELAARTGTVDAAKRHNGCAHATPACAAGCLAFAGHAGLSVAPIAARGRRTLAMIADPLTYGRALTYAIASQLQRAARVGLPLAVRLCGTDETPWFARTFPLSVADVVRIRRRYGVDVAPGAVNVADAFAPETARGALHLYEYLKARADAPDGLSAWHAAGWDVTASFAADRPTACADAVAAVRAGFRVAFAVTTPRGAAPFRSVTVETTRGDVVTLPAVDGDSTDARYADPAGVAVMLRRKLTRGAPRIADAFFLRDVTTPQRLADGAVTLSR